MENKAQKEVRFAEIDRTACGPTTCKPIRLMVGVYLKSPNSITTEAGKRVYQPPYTGTVGSALGQA